MSWTSFKEMMCQLKIILVALLNQQVSTTIGKKFLFTRMALAWKYIRLFSLLSAGRGRGREIAEFEGYTTLPNFSATGKKVENETTNVYLSLKGFFLSVYKETEI